MRTYKYCIDTIEPKRRWYEIHDFMMASYVNPFNRAFWRLVRGKIIYYVWYALVEMDLIETKPGDLFTNSTIVPLGELPKYRRKRTKP